MEKHKELFESMPVPKAIAKSAIPAILSMLVVLIYNIADIFFVGQTGDPYQVASISLTTPVFLLFMAIGNLFGIGGTSVISRALGAGKNNLAKKVSSFCFYASIGIGLLCMALFWIFMENILQIIGSSKETVNFARNYLNYIAFSAPFVIISTAFSNIVRAEGKSKEAMFGMMLGTVINITFDPIMILGFKMGVTGAAIATVIGNIAGTIYYILFFLRKKSILSIAIRDLEFKSQNISGVFAIGFPASLNNILMSVSFIVFNGVLAVYGDIQVAAMGVASKVNMIIVMLQIGLAQGSQPLLGYNYGARNFKRFNQILRLSITYSVIIGVSLSLICWLSAGKIVQSFIDNENVLNYGIIFVKALMLSGPFIGILFIFTNTLQAMGAVAPSLILSLSRQGIVFIPTLFILNALAGLSGIIYAMPLAEYLSIILSVVLYRNQIKKSYIMENCKE